MKVPPKKATNPRAARANRTSATRAAPADGEAAAMSLEDAQRYRILTESSFDIVCEIDTESRLRYLSPNYHDVLGWNVEEMLGTDALEPVHPEDQAAASLQIKQSFQAGWGRLHLRVRHSDGQWRWFECIGRSFTTPEGGLRILVISRDVTERVWSEQRLQEAHDDLEQRVARRTAEWADANRRLLGEIAEREKVEQQLRSSEERLRRVVENSPDVVMTLDREGTILSVHLPTSQALTEEEESAVGTLVYQWVPKDQRAAMRAAIEGVIQTGNSGQYEVQDKLKRDWYLSRVGPIRADGQITGVVIISTNVTAQKKAEQDLRVSQQALERKIIERTAQLATANEQLRDDILRREETERQLRESEERFRAIAEANPVPVMISRFSDGRILYGNERLVEFLGTERHKLHSQSTLDYYSNPQARTHLMRALSRDGMVKNYEVEAKKKDGTTAWLFVSNRRITYQGEVAVLTSFLDMTERKLDEERLRHERTVLKQMLDLQDRDRQLTAYEIHDGLVQDMTGALMYLEAARSATTNRERSANENKSVLLLQGAINEARRLINGLRPPILDEEGVVPAVEHLIADLRQLVGLKVRLKHRMRRERLSPAVENSIYRVVQEALTNVHRHSGKLSATAELIETDGWLRISVRDRGKGFNPKKIPQSRFGLAGLQERARLFGGRAQFRSAIGKGTTIVVEIPLDDVLPAADCPSILNNGEKTTSRKSAKASPAIVSPEELG